MGFGAPQLHDFHSESNPFEEIKYAELQSLCKDLSSENEANLMNGILVLDLGDPDSYECFEKITKRLSTHENVLTHEIKELHVRILVF